MKFFPKAREGKRAIAGSGYSPGSVDGLEVQPVDNPTSSGQTLRPTFVPDKDSPPVSEKLESEASSKTEVPSASSPQEALREAAEKLKQSIEKSGIDAKLELDPIHGSYDINSLSNCLELALDKLIKKTNVADANQNIVKAFAKEWAKKSIPFLEKGLAAAEVSLPP